MYKIEVKDFGISAQTDKLIFYKWDELLNSLLSSYENSSTNSTKRSLANVENFCRNDQNYRIGLNPILRLVVS